MYLPLILAYRMELITQNKMIGWVNDKDIGLKTRNISVRCHSSFNYVIFFLSSFWLQNNLILLKSEAFDGCP